MRVTGEHLEKLRGLVRTRETKWKSLNQQLALVAEPEKQAALDMQQAAAKLLSAWDKFWKDVELDHVAALDLNFWLEKAEEEK